MKSLVKIFAIALAFFATNAVQAQTVMAKKDNMKSEMHKHADHAEPTVIKLSQTPGAYTTQSLDLKPGAYIFEITNENVDHPVAFFLTTTDDTKTPVKNSMLDGGVVQGNSAQSGVVHLTAGNYKYSCPMNSTPQYNLTVKE